MSDLPGFLFALAFSIAAGASLIGLAELLGRRRGQPAPQRQWLLDFLFIGFIAAGVFPLLSDWLSFEHNPVKDGFGLAMIAVALVGLIRQVIVHWNDEDDLADLAGVEEGYIVRHPRGIPVRLRATLLVVLLAGLTVAVSLSYIHTLLSE